MLQASPAARHISPLVLRLACRCLHQSHASGSSSVLLPPLARLVHPQNVQLLDVQLQNVQLQNVHLPDVQLQNVQITKRPDYQTSLLPNVQITKRPVTERPVTKRPH
jgi:hypothetical protein